jgi:ABC-2 type transport system ATP-binding protein
MNDKIILEVKNLTKQFGNFVAVNNISFSIKEGEIVGFLGQNGAGKTTTIQMLMGSLTPTSGTISYFGKDLKKHRSEIVESVNFSSTYTNLPWDLTVKENLTFISYLYEIKKRKERVETVIEMFKLEDLKNKQIRALSAGQITRVNLAKAFINFPKVLLLDEPTASLDPDIAKYVRDFLLEQRRKHELSIIITSHNMAEVEEVCDRVIFINKGEIVSDDTPERLAKSIKLTHINLIIQEHMQKAIAYCEKEKIQHEVDEKHLSIEISEKRIPKLLSDLSDLGILYSEITIEKPTLEDYFFQMVSERKIHESS